MSDKTKTPSLTGDAFGLTTEIKCPVCGELKKPEMLRILRNDLSGQDDSFTGYALVTKCCQAIVAKSRHFDYIRGLFREEIEKLEKKGWKIVNGIVITDKPEVLKKRSITSPRPKTQYVEEIYVGDERVGDGQF